MDSINPFGQHRHRHVSVLSDISCYYPLPPKTVCPSEAIYKWLQVGWGLTLFFSVLNLCSKKKSGAFLNGPRKKRSLQWEQNQGDSPLFLLRLHGIFEPPETKSMGDWVLRSRKRVLMLDKHTQQYHEAPRSRFSQAEKQVNFPIYTFPEEKDSMQILQDFYEFSGFYYSILSLLCFSILDHRCWSNCFKCNSACKQVERDPWTLGFFFFFFPSSMMQEASSKSSFIITTLTGCS